MRGETGRTHVRPGAADEETDVDAAALGVAIAVNAGATLVYAARVMDAYAAKALPAQP